MTTPAPLPDALKVDLLARGASKQLEVAILLALSGLKRSEILGLRYRDLDQRRGLVIVTSAIVKRPAGLIRVAVPVRAVLADERVWDCLGRHELAQQRRAWERPWPMNSPYPGEPRAPVLTARDGSVMSPGTLNGALTAEKGRQRLEGPALTWPGLSRLGKVRGVKPSPHAESGQVVRESRALSAAG